MMINYRILRCTLSDKANGCETIHCSLQSQPLIQLLFFTIDCRFYYCGGGTLTNCKHGHGTRSHGPNDVDHVDFPKLDNHHGISRGV